MKLGAGVDPRQDGKSRGCEGIEEERRSRQMQNLRDLGGEEEQASEANLMDPRPGKRPKWHKNVKRCESTRTPKTLS